MKTVKSLILGSAAALLAMSGAQAADLPLKAKAVEYVKVCSLYGAGFYYIPGTDTCIKLGGYLRAEYALNTNSVISGQFNVSSQGDNGGQNRLTNYYTQRAREDFNIDTRTATEYGVVRTYFDAVFSWTSGNYVGTNGGTGTTQYSGTLGVGNNPVGTAANPVSLYGSGSGNVNATDGNTSGGSIGVYYAFIQFAGFTMGKAVSTFDAPWNNYPGNNFDGLVGGGGTVTGIDQLTYTADFGQGITASISAEDPSSYDQAGNLNVSGATGYGLVGGTYGSNAIGGTRAPNVIGTIRVDQAWGLFQANVAVKDNHVGYYGATETSGHPDDKLGWAAQLSLSIKNIPTGPGDTFNIQGVYTEGATRYNFQNLSGSTYSMWGASAGAGAYGSVGFASAPDTVYTNTSQQENVETWGFRGAFTHNWDAYWNSALYGAYAGVRYGSIGRTGICAAFFSASATTGLGVTPATATCNPDFNIAQAGFITRWTPVKNLTFSADLTYTHLDQKYSGNITLPNTLAVPAKPAAVYQLKDQDTVQLLLRAQRNW